MHTGFIHSHVLIVTLYLVQLFIKLVLVAAKKEEALEKFQKKTKIAHMVLATLMLITGGYLLFASVEGIPAPYTQPYMWIKIVLIVASIPLGIVGVKKRNVFLTGLSFFLLVGVMAMAYMFDPTVTTDQDAVNKELTELTEENNTAEVKLSPEELAGQAIYNTNCVQCHGKDGKLGLQGAKDLTVTELTDEEQADLVRNGKYPMPAYPSLSDEDISNLTSYVKTLK